MTDYGFNGLHHASKSGDLRRVEQLLQTGAFDINAGTESRRNQNALHLAAQHGISNGSVLARLIHAGADIDARDAYGMTPLMHAAICKAVAAVEVLLAAGADVHAKDDTDAAALHWSACERGNVGIVGRLLAAGAEVDAVMISKSTPLCCACWWSCTDVVEALLQAGAQINTRNKVGQTPLYLAASGQGSQAAVAATTASLIHAGAELKTDDALSVRAATTLVAAGCRCWNQIPARCPDLKDALFSVWQHHPDDLRHLFLRLDETTKKRIRSILLCLHRCMSHNAAVPGQRLEEMLKLKILQEVLH